MKKKPTKVKTENWNLLWLKYKKINEKKIRKFIDVFNLYKIPKDKRIIDIGCGSGELLHVFQKRGYKYLMGIEPERELFKQGDLIQRGNCLDLSNIKKSYDIVFMFGVLHHLKNFGEMKLCLQNVKKIMKKEGSFYSIEPYNSLLRTLITKAILETPLCNIHPFFKIHSKLWGREKVEFNHWLKAEKKFTAYAKNQDFKIVFFKKDIRYRYIIFKNINKLK